MSKLLKFAFDAVVRLLTQIDFSINRFLIFEKMPGSHSCLGILIVHVSTPRHLRLISLHTDGWF